MYVLLVRGSLPKGNVVVVLCRIVRFHFLLRDKVNSSLVIGLNANSLVVHETSVCSGVLVGEVQWIARELNSAARSALHEVGILIACTEVVSHSISAWTRWTHERSPRRGQGRYLGVPTSCSGVSSLRIANAAEARIVG